jgi:hypothetical protein
MSPAGFLACGNAFVCGYIGFALNLEWLEVRDAWVWLVVAGGVNLVLAVASWRGEI